MLIFIYLSDSDKEAQPKTKEPVPSYCGNLLNVIQDLLLKYTGVCCLQFVMPTGQSPRHILQREAGPKHCRELYQTDFSKLCLYFFYFTLPAWQLFHYPHAKAYILLNVGEMFYVTSYHGADLINI